MPYFTHIYQSDLNHRAKTVYIYLKDRADAQGRCWPAINTIAADLRISRGRLLALNPTLLPSDFSSGTVICIP